MGEGEVDVAFERRGGVSDGEVGVDFVLEFGVAGRASEEVVEECGESDGTVKGRREEKNQLVAIRAMDGIWTWGVRFGEGGLTLSLLQREPSSDSSSGLLSRSWILNAFPWP